MCLVLIGYQVEPNTPMVIVANRDEFFERPTLQAGFWEDSPDIFAGKDEEEGGTWLGVSRQGRLAAVTNWTETLPNNQADLSRGNLVADFLRGTDSSSNYVQLIEGKRFRGFNLIVYDGNELIYCSNRINEPRVLNPGIYGLSNTQLGARWMRVVRGEQKLAEQIKKPDLRSLVEGLRDEGESEVELVAEEKFTGCFILGEDYGTRATTALIMRNDKVQVREQTYGPMGQPMDSVETEFALGA